MVENINNQENRMIDLPEPNKGVTSEIFLDLLSDRSQFVKKALTNLKDENPNIAGFMIKDCIISPDPERSLDFSLSYYEIFSRSARKSGRRLLLVTEETFTSTFGIQIRDLQFAEHNPSDTSSYLHKEENQRNQLVEDETSLSDELAEFWATVRIWELNQLMAGRNNPVAIELILKTLYTVSTLLYKQQDSNSLSQQFS